MLYKLIRRLLFCLSPEQAHHLTLSLLKFFYRPFLTHLYLKFLPLKPKKLWGLTFPNPLGLAAGLDKNGDYVDSLLGLGFGFVEIGSVTPKPQVGNPKPRLFRIPGAEALINRMGFNNHGVRYCVEKMKKRRVAGIVGINIGKNASTPLEEAVHDYRFCLTEVFPYADYVTINVSSPNTPGLRNLQSEHYLADLLTQLKSTQKELTTQFKRQVPLLLKITVDLTCEEQQQIAATALKYQIEGIIISNTTLDHSSVTHLPHGNETGGLSGRPLFKRVLEAVTQIHQYTRGELPIIAVGGIFSAEDALSLLAAGASLIQIYTGFIYQGPGLIRKIIRKI